MHILSQVAGFVSENGLILCPNLAGFLARSGRFLTSEIGWFYFTTDTDAIVHPFRNIHLAGLCYLTSTIFGKNRFDAYH
jgi:hypothetical protein